MRDAGVHGIAFLVRAALWIDLVRRRALVPALADLLAMAQGGQRLDVDPAVVTIVDAEEGDAATDRQDDVVGRPASGRLDALGPHAGGAGRNPAKGGPIGELL